jgi:hypothetical protein
MHKNVNIVKVDNGLACREGGSGQAACTCKYLRRTDVVAWRRLGNAGVPCSNSTSHTKYYISDSRSLHNILNHPV